MWGGTPWTLARYGRTPWTLARYGRTPWTPRPSNNPLNVDVAIKVAQQANPVGLKKLVDAEVNRRLNAEVFTRLNKIRREIIEAAKEEVRQNEDNFRLTCPRCRSPCISATEKATSLPRFSPRSTMRLEPGHIQHAWVMGTRDPEEGNCLPFSESFSMNCELSWKTSGVSVLTRLGRIEKVKPIGFRHGRMSQTNIEPQTSHF